MEMQDLERDINNPDKTIRMEASVKLGSLIESNDLRRTALQEVNNHVHTTWSFSPYEPAAAAFKAWKAGLGIVGSIDHDSIGAATEMLDSAQNIGIASTVGFEIRVSFKDTVFADRKINNPDSEGLVYMCVHGVPRQKIGEVEAFLKPVHAIRNKRNEAQIAALQALVGPYGYDLDFKRDIVPLSRSAEGGSITERHILYAMALQTIAMFKKGEKLVSFVKNDLQVPLSQNIESLLLDTDNPHYAYDLLGVLKGNFLPRFFIQPEKAECPDVRQVVSFGTQIGAIPAYAYLGDIEKSVTGDKKSERFEDAYLVELMDLLSDIGFPAITYMPPRNTVQQMKRLQGLARERGMMEISGVDINSSRQSFNCPELLGECCNHLVDSAWALVAHEKLSTCNQSLGLFSADNPLSSLSLADRVKRYAAIGRRMDVRQPLEIIHLFE
ncbi:hypothetical protein SpiGrapes_2591 [Sphaerochaeta pleomorpha str. Grapes]|uniref:Uncharacterized protein n=1 Tax=Sphaerochaeta pleomorpha (strain ATCC BAA-1885 / DSM 22778 / Grapes) TaxID=158190 RepID=G8QUP4_SPHPG|nr:hypothetical protein [Sphaerochaeta pleomorpha]AEV30352.1 hypothetical protein SpiGrapes_2591 [Sphaerochaeta pleomorpha str. Grapes]